MPQPVEGNPNLWTPGIKYGVRPGSFTHLTEFFGPVLAVMRFDKLSEAVALVNQTGYGLTSGLESLDEREWDYWKNHIHAGNLYINRVTTGAVVLRQPFGGIGKSVFGLGMKAGGPNYVAQFMDFTDLPTAQPEGALSKPTLASLCDGLGAAGNPDGPKIIAAARSYDVAAREEFQREHDHFKLVGQDNFRRYRPLESVRVRVHAEDSAFEVFARACAGHAAGCRVTMSVPTGLKSPAVYLLEQLTESWAGDLEFIEESDEQLIAAMAGRQTDRVRYAAAVRVPQAVLKAAAAAGVCVAANPVSGQGRLELLWYLHEQSVSIDYHRYGNLGSRVAEPRAEVL
jgi:RHH-type proline utilization regulon transcriptional repressor/proline dehydrogenase/delta 1-pyrroline-5-carboxylate dehydrogenase